MQFNFALNYPVVICWWISSISCGIQENLCRREWKSVNF